MSKYQSIVSAIISAICIFVLPVLNRKGIILDEGTVTTIVFSVIAVGAFLWSCWKNHNITMAANEAQCILEDLKEGFAREELAEDELSEAEAEEMEKLEEGEK